MAKNNDFVVIMAGGIGSRFWPDSRVAKPKQFLDILGTGKSLLQMTYDRFKQIFPKENIFVIINSMYEETTKKQLPDLKKENLLKEPMRRNTAPCIAYACNAIVNINPEANVVVAPSDHIVMKESAFFDSIKRGLKFVKSHDALLTLGITPSRPDTGYGYIQIEEEEIEQSIHKVKTFTEKPTLEIAKSFLKSGDFLWNSGIFVFNVISMLEAFRTYQPEIHDAFEDVRNSHTAYLDEKVISNAYSHCTNISIDYGVMEKAKNVFVIPSRFGWSDLGTWGSLYEHRDKDYLGNAVQGKNVVIYDASNCMVMAPDQKLVVLQGLEDFIVIDTADVLLIIKKSNEQEIKDITADIKRQKGEKFL